MKSTNLDHQTYFAERALIAMEKSGQYFNECGCAPADDPKYYTIQTLKKAVNPYDWEAGRFYTKKSLQQIYDLITILDECSLNNVSKHEDVNEVPDSKNREEIALSEIMKINLKNLDKELNRLIQPLRDNPIQEGHESAQKLLYTDRLKEILYQRLTELKSIQEELPD